MSHRLHSWRLQLSYSTYFYTRTPEVPHFTPVHQKIDFAPMTADYHQKIAQDGFVVVRNLLSPSEIAQYREAALAVVQYAREGHWPHVRTRGKQFPPWPKNFSPDIWGVSGLLHPDLGSMAKPFEQCYALSNLLDVAADILETNRDDLSMELFNMLINPLTDFGLDWHRDTIRAEASAEEEAKDLLSDPYAGTQFNLALTEDKCLIAIPGSHNRVRTDEERLKTTGEDRQQHISGEVSVELHPGDVVFYNNNILHRAQYLSKELRLTLHGLYGHPTKGHLRAKGILQHGVSEWLPRFQPKDPQLVLMRARLEKLATEFKGVDLGYALEG